jgi:hypothetical protein
MRTDLTEIAFVLDRSGSMESIRSDAMGGFNAFLSSQRMHPGAARLSVILFDHEYQLLHEAVDLARVPILDEHTYIPRGTTALLDAIGRTVDDLGVRLARMPELERPGKVIVAILTDGLENASSDYSPSKVAEMIEHQKSRYGWEFIFLAANQDAIATAQALSIDAQDAISFTATGTGVREAYSTLDTAIRQRRSKQSPRA